MGLFDKLFGKKAPEVSEKTVGCTIDIRGDCFVINGKKLEVPMHIDALSAVLGTPRRVAFKTKEDDRRFVEEVMHDTMTQRVNYTWDDLGLMCYTYNGSVVNTFGIRLNPSDCKAPSEPKKLFGGKLTINGGHWLPAALAGEDCDVFRHIYVGEYLLTAEYTDFDQDDSTRDESSFTGIEIQLKGNDDL